MCAFKGKYCSYKCAKLFHNKFDQEVASPRGRHKAVKQAIKQQRRLWRSGEGAQLQRQKTNVKRRIISYSPPQQDTTATLPNQIIKRTIVPTDQESKTTIKVHIPRKHFTPKQEIKESLKQLKRQYLRTTDPETEYEFLGKISKVSNVRNYAHHEQYRVTAARRRTTRQTVAIKILPVRGFFERTLQGEIYTRTVISSQFPSLPHIVKTQELFAYNDKLYLVMEYLPFPLNKFQRLYFAQFNSLIPQAIIAKVIRDILIALNTLHTFNFVHSDIKPGNVLVNQDLEFKLTDFGQCYRMNKSYLDHVHGTDGYSSQDKAYGTSEDIYSIGRLTIYLLVGAQQWFQNFKLNPDIKQFLEMTGISNKAKEFVKICVAKQRPSASHLLLNNEFIHLAEHRGSEYQTMMKEIKLCMAAIQQF